MSPYLAGIGVQRGVEDQFGPAHLLPGQTVPGGIEPQSHAVFGPAHRQGFGGTEQHCPQSRAIGGGDHLRHSGAVGEQAVQVLFQKAPQSLPSGADGDFPAEPAQFLFHQRIIALHDKFPGEPDDLVQGGVGYRHLPADLPAEPPAGLGQGRTGPVAVPAPGKLQHSRLGSSPPEPGECFHHA